jgi:trans-2,3-dihydro-3-hydroxyanthranilate isomerase
LAYRIVDVFTGSAYAGNPLAVVFGADDLPTEALQAIAREFNLSETVFPLPVSPAGAAAGADYRARIFTPVTELPFAGHPSIGAAWVLREAGLLPGDGSRVVQECGAGMLPLQFLDLGGEPVVRLQGGSPRFGPAVDAAALVAAVCLLTPDTVDVGRTPPRWCGAGIDFCFLRVQDSAVARAVPDLTAVSTLGGAGLMVFSWDERQRRAHARVFAGGAGVLEDPATGSAAIGLGVWLAVSRMVPDEGESSYTIQQGIEMGRPSLLHGTVTVTDGVVSHATVAGSVVPVAEGTIRPPSV